MTEQVGRFTTCSVTFTGGPPALADASLTPLTSGPPSQTRRHTPSPDPTRRGSVDAIMIDLTVLGNVTVANGTSLIVRGTITGDKGAVTVSRLRIEADSTG
jgi:hypothetical protein